MGLLEFVIRRGEDAIAFAAYALIDQDASCIAWRSGELRDRVADGRGECV